MEHLRKEILAVQNAIGNRKGNLAGWPRYNGADGEFPWSEPPRMDIAGIPKPRTKPLKFGNKAGNDLDDEQIKRCKTELVELEGKLANLKQQLLDKQNQQSPERAGDDAGSSAPPRAKRARRAESPEEAAGYDECTMAIAVISERKAKDDDELDVTRIFGERNAKVTYLRNKMDACDKRLEETTIHDDQSPEEEIQIFEKHMFDFHDGMGFKLFWFPYMRSRYVDFFRNLPDRPTVEFLMFMYLRRTVVSRLEDRRYFDDSEK